MSPTQINIDKKDYHILNWYKLYTLFLACILLALQLNHIFNFPIWRDDAFFASLAKNLASGVGYKAVFFDKNYLFHYGISSGPTIILPATFLVLLFGNQFWVPSIANFLLIWGLLISIFIVSKDLLGKDRRWIFCLLALLYTLLFSMLTCNNCGSDFGIEIGDQLALWHLMMGEVPAMLFLILGTLLLFSPQITCAKIIWGGLILGLALVTKSIAAIGCSMILMMFTIRILFKERSDNSKIFSKETTSKIILVAICAISFVAPSLLLELVKIISAGWTQYLELQTQNFLYYSNNISPITYGLVRTYGPVRLNYFSNYFIKYSTPLLLLITIYIAAISKKSNNKYSSHLAGITLLLCFCCHLLWWVMFSNGSDRYLIISFFYFFSGFALLVANIEQRNKRISQIIIFTTFLIFTARINVVQYIFSEGFSKNTRLQEQLMISKAVSDLQQQGVTLVACSNNFELEYLLPNANNFKNCTELKQEFPKNKVVLVTQYFRQRNIISIRHDQYRGEIKPLPDFAANLCSDVFLESTNYSLRWCKQPIKKS